MPWPVYSERFLHHQAAGTWTYTVPDGTRAIVTSISLVAGEPPPGDFQVWIGPICMAVFLPQAQLDRLYLATYQVAYQGEQIKLINKYSGQHATISGYLLKDDSGRTGPPLQASTKPVDPFLPRPTPLAEAR